MSGGSPTCSTTTRILASRVSKAMVDLESARRRGRGALRALVEEHVGAHAQRARKEHPRDVGEAPLREGHASRVAPHSPAPEDREAMGNPKGFLKLSREEEDERPVEERVQDWRELVVPATDAQLRGQASRCMDCGIPFCHQGCPLGNLIPEWNDLVYKGRMDEAARRLHETNNFPEVTGASARRRARRRACSTSATSR
jgi:ferredoxin